jgi:hypothetical protein
VDARCLTYSAAIPAAYGKTCLVRIYLGFPMMNCHLLPDEKLAILQQADPRRKWYSLDDARVCVLCDRAITGREIEVVRDDGNRYALRCPTKGCPSLPSDWFYRGCACSNPRNPSGRTAEASFDF